jgi:aryl-alcohol dehydrogenase-like predicted oxidoreductase
MERRLFGSTGVSYRGSAGGHLVHREKGHRASAIAALRRGLDLGMTHIGTAQLYGGARQRSW